MWGVICDPRHMPAQMTLRNFDPVVSLFLEAGLSHCYPHPPGDKKRRNDRRDGQARAWHPHDWGSSAGYPHIPSPYDYDDLTDSSLEKDLR